MLDQNQRWPGNQEYYSGHQQSAFPQQSHENQPYFNQPASQVSIKNPQAGQLPKAKGPEMNDRDRLNDMLATEKYLTDNFNVFVREASYTQLHRDVSQILNQTHQEARNLFTFMFNQGWYSLQAESAQQIAQAAQQFGNYQTQFAHNQQSSSMQTYQNPVF